MAGNLVTSTSTVINSSSTMQNRRRNAPSTSSFIVGIFLVAIFIFGTLYHMAEYHRPPGELLKHAKERALIPPTLRYKFQRAANSLFELASSHNDSFSVVGDSIQATDMDGKIEPAPDLGTHVATSTSSKTELVSDRKHFHDATLSVVSVPVSNKEQIGNGKDSKNNDSKGAKRGHEQVKRKKNGDGNSGKGDKYNKKGKRKGKQQPKKKRRPRDPFNFVKEIDPKWGFPGVWDLKYIKVMPTPKIAIKKDRRVVFPNMTIDRPPRSQEPPTGQVGFPRELIKANQILKTHPLLDIEHFDHHGKSLEEVLYFMNNTAECYQKPIFLTMATVHDDLYWQLIENFVYTMVKFGMSGCALVICVSDDRCMELCKDAYFPCYEYQAHETPMPHVMEQIAQVKLLHIPKVLSQGVDVFLLDLDVGFLESPSAMVKAYLETPIVDVFVQEDYIFLMNRSIWEREHWKQWFTEPLPNIGLFLCRGNNRTARVFELAWQKYQKITDPWEKMQPGRDQNCVLDSMRIGRGTFGLKYAYFSNLTAPLLDKLVLNYGNVMELGGEVIESLLDHNKAIAMHTTCYEKSTKVMGLKASNAFWNPRYYDPLRPTLTKQILFLNENALLDEVRSLIWLAIITDRSVVVPNILGHEKMKTIGSFRKQVMWPGFRVVFLKRSKGKNQLKVEILEPGYYWRVNRDYDTIPDPDIVYFDPAKDDLGDIRDSILRRRHSPRIIIHPDVVVSGRRKVSKLSKAPEALQQAVGAQIRAWANDSVGIFPEPFSVLKVHYKPIPSVKTIRGVKGLGGKLVEEVLQGMRTCNDVFGPSKGNRTCFQICD